MWCFPPKQSAEFVYHMEDVLEVYHRLQAPKRPVVRVDELPAVVRMGEIARGGSASAALACGWAASS
jgi:hypothetical protein